MKHGKFALLFIVSICFAVTSIAGATNYAVLISAGKSTADDAMINSEYWYDLLLTYEMLIDNNYEHNNIYVLYGEGTGFNSSHERYHNPYPQEIVDYNNHKATIQSVFASLSGVITSNDQLYVWWLGHGAPYGSNLGLTLENSGEVLMDYDFASYVNQIEYCGLRAFSFMTCNSGGIIDDLQGLNTIVMTSADFYTPSNSDNLCDTVHTEFHYHETNAYHWQTPFEMCGPIDADTSNDDIISFSEGYVHAAAGTGSNPQISDLGGNGPVNYLENLSIACDSYIIDDDNLGASSGNGNGAIEYGETIELTVTLVNRSENDLFAVTGSLDLDDEYITITTGSGAFGNIPSNGGTGTGQPAFVFSVSNDVPDNYYLGFSLTLSTDDIVGLGFTARAPELKLIAYEIDDFAGGDGDGKAEPGETIDLSATIRNDGSITADDTKVALAGDPYLALEALELSIGTLAPDQSIDIGPVELVVDPLTPEIYTGTITAILSATDNYHRARVIIFNVGDVFVDDMEIGDQWSHYSGSTGHGDQWHLETYRNYSESGSQSWKNGGNGNSDYGNQLHAVLESAPFIVPEDASLSLWYWIAAEVYSSDPSYAWDGGNIEISVDGGDWELLVPVEGYSHTVWSSSTSPIPPGTAVWSGESDWQEALFDLTGYSGSVRIRCVFGSDGSVTREGWYIDDVRLMMPFFSGSDEQIITRSIRLHPARPNPTQGQTELRLDLPQSAEVSVRVFDASGRSVRLLQSGRLSSGRHLIEWDGFTDAETDPGTGVYWIRAVVDGQINQTRLIRLR